MSIINNSIKFELFLYIVRSMLYEYNLIIIFKIIIILSKNHAFIETQCISSLDKFLAININSIFCDHKM